MNPSVELRATPGKGTGVFATRDIGPGETAIVGVIAQELAGNTAHASQIGPDRFVIFGNLHHRVNHSCDPNCGIRVNASGAHDLVARRPIAADEEITFDYAMQNHRIEHFGVACRCGAARCRGEVTGWARLPADLKRAYAPWAAPYLLELSPVPSASSSSRTTPEVPSTSTC